MENELNAKINLIVEATKDCRYLEAMRLYTELMTESEKYDNDQLQNHLSQNSEILNTLKERTEEIQNTLNLEDVNDETWKLGITLLGVTTHYRVCDDSTLIVKMNGIIEDLPLFEQVAVINEVDLFKTWFPFCTDSKLVEQIGRAEVAMYMNLGLSIADRDCLMHAYGADCSQETGKILILGKSVEIWKGSEGPLRPVGWFHNRLVVKEMKMIFEVLSPYSAKGTLIAHVDPNYPLPQSVINFFIKNFAGVILYNMQKQAVKVRNNPNCPHGDQIRAKSDFYLEWLLPKMRKYCDLKGWKQPAVPSLGAAGDPPEEEKKNSSIEKPNQI